MADYDPVTKVVIPAAGLGTRFLPATKATPKEMLPVVDKPAIQYVVEEAVQRGPDRRPDGHRRRQARPSRTTSTGRTSWRRRCRPRATTTRLALVREPTEMATMHYVRQGDAEGPRPRRAVRRQHVGDEPFAVLLGDDLIDSARPAAAAHDRGPAAARRQRRRADGGRARAGLLVRLRRDQADRRGGRRRGHRPGGEARRRTRPRPTGSSSAVTCCDPAVFDVLREDPAGPRRRDPAHRRPAELAGRAQRPRAARVHGVLFRGRRYDTGNKLDYLRTRRPVRAASGRTWPASSCPGCAATSAPQ